jgi:hypothetical protein
MRFTNRIKQRGATGYILLWLLEIPISVLLLICSKSFFTQPAAKFVLKWRPQKGQQIKAQEHAASGGLSCTYCVIF